MTQSKSLKYVTKTRRFQEAKFFKMKAWPLILKVAKNTHQWTFLTTFCWIRVPEGLILMIGIQLFEMETLLVTNKFHQKSVYQFAHTPERR